MPVHVCAYAYVHVFTCVCVWAVCIPVCLCLSMLMCMCVPCACLVNVSTHSCMLVYVCVHMCLCVCVFTCTCACTLVCASVCPLAQSLSDWAAGGGLYPLTSHLVGSLSLIQLPRWRNQDSERVSAQPRVTPREPASVVRCECPAGSCELPRHSENRVSSRLRPQSLARPGRAPRTPPPGTWGRGWCQPQAWHVFEVSFYLKHSCKLAFALATGLCLF